MVKTYIVFIHFYPAMLILLVVSLFVISIYIEKIIKTIIYNLLVNNTLCEGGCVKTKNSEKLPFILTVSLPHKY